MTPQNPSGPRKVSFMGGCQFRSKESSSKERLRPGGMEGLEYFQPWKLCRISCLKPWCLLSIGIDEKNVQWFVLVHKKKNPECATSQCTHTVGFYCNPCQMFAKRLTASWYSYTCWSVKKKKKFFCRQKECNPFKVRRRTQLAAKN